MGLLNLFNPTSQDQPQGLLSGLLASPSDRAMLAAAASALQASGPSLVPVSTGQALGRMINAGLGAYDSGTNQQQQQALGALKMKALQGEVDDAQTARDRAAKLSQFYANYQPGSSSAPQSQPAAAAPAAASTAPAQSIMFQSPGAASSMPDWMQAYQQSNAGSPSAAAATSTASSTAATDPYGQHMTLASALRAKGFNTEADAQEAIALKFRPTYSTSFSVARGTDGQLHNYVLSNDGAPPKDVGLGVKPDVAMVDLGGSQQVYDKNTITPGTAFKKTQSPDSIAADQRAANSGPDVDPKQVENVAQMIASGRMAPLTSMAMRSPYGQAVMSRVAELNPNFNGMDYGASSKAARDFATGKQGNAVRSFNVLLSHLDTLGQLSDSLNNGDNQAFNRLGNYLATQTGGAAPTNFDAVKHIVSDEVVKAVTGGAGALGDRTAMADAINKANSPAQLKGVISNIKSLALGQLGGLDQQYQTSTRRNDFNRFLSPQALALYSPGQAALPRSPSVSGSAAPGQSSPAGQFQVTAPNGKTYTFSNSKDLANFKLKTGLQ